VDGAPNCSRLGCDKPAVAVFAFDARECLVWLDPLGPGGRGAGVLCDAHADRMSPPRGWNLLDRRGVESRLWIGRAPTPAPAHVTRSPRRREHTPRSRPLAAPGPLLPFDAPVARESEPPARTPEPTKTPAPTPARTSWSPHDRPGPEFEHVLDARTPLLARAFEGSRPVDDE
jgi:Protein of unknown function (DUF3499)